MEKYQTFRRRVGAAIIDAILLFILNWVVVSVVFFINAESVLLSLALPGLISALYFILLHHYGGQTIGKKTTEVEVLDDTETPVTLGQSILRSLPQLILPMFAVSFSTADKSSADSILVWGAVITGFTSLFFIVNVVVCIASSKNRALHDFIAGTIVVRADI